MVHEEPREKERRWTNLMNNNSGHIHAQHLPSLVSSSVISNSKEDMWELYLSRGLRGKFHSKFHSMRAA
jgi:hypothetical protein